MHYFVGAIFLVFLLFILPTTAIVAISVFLLFLHSSFKPVPLLSPSQKYLFLNPSKP